MKQSKATPVFKSGCKSDLNDYCAVSVLLAFNKIFKTLDNLLKHLNLNKLLHENQFNFRKGRNTTNADTKLIADIFNT